MKERRTISEDREAKRRAYAEKHALPCPHCGKQVLDHMTQCPHCGGELKPKGYTPLTDKQIKRIKLVTFIVGMAVAIVVFYFVVVKK